MLVSDASEQVLQIHQIYQRRYNYTDRWIILNTYLLIYKNKLLIQYSILNNKNNKQYFV